MVWEQSPHLKYKTKEMTVDVRKKRNKQNNIITLGEEVMEDYR